MTQIEVKLCTHVACQQTGGLLSTTGKKRVNQSFQWTGQRLFLSQEYLWSGTNTDILDTCCLLYKTLGAPRLNSAASQTIGEKSCSDSIYRTLTFFFLTCSITSLICDHEQVRSLVSSFVKRLVNNCPHIWPNISSYKSTSDDKY